MVLDTLIQRDTNSQIESFQMNGKTAYENVYGPIIKPVPVDASTVYVYPDGQAYPQHMYI